ncbi:MAG: hypothetical protein COB22_02455 [Cycloclasticus sp.]|nr:MAG: hypothetical protein COB22_02455 [Cycloclasticus sp.]
MSASAKKVIPFETVESMDQQYLKARDKLVQVENLSTGTKVVRVGVANFRFALEVGLAVETIRYKVPQVIPRSYPWMLGLIELRGEVIPVVDFAAFNNQGKTSIDKSCRLLIVRQEQAVYAMLVNSVSAVTEVNDFFDQKDKTAPKVPSGISIKFDQWVEIEGEKIHFLDLHALGNQADFLKITF